MTQSVVTATTNATFQQLVDLMLRHGVSGIPIVDERRRPIGIVTEADLVSKEAYGARRRLLDVAATLAFGAENVWATKAKGLTAAEIMTAPVRTAHPDDQVRLAAARMVSTGVKRLPVVDDDGRLVGIVSRTDVLRVFHRGDDETTLDVIRVLQDPLLVPEDHTVTASVQDGIVTLHGTVTAASHVRLIDAMLREVPGVIDVTCDIGVRDRQVRVLSGRPRRWAGANQGRRGIGERTWVPGRRRPARRHCNHGDRPPHGHDPRAP